MPLTCASSDPFRRDRDRMVAALREYGIDSEPLLAAFRRVPRHLFVPPDLVPEAYDDRPLSIGCDQTISQPYIVALMTDCLELSGSERVLEIGTGSGYQAAILAELAREVHTVERLQDLASRARSTLDSLGYSNIRFSTADGALGLPSAAPFDAIIVTAAAPRIPDALVSQLAPSGRLVIPVGPPAAQTLKLLLNSPSGLLTSDVCACVFVKLISPSAYPPES